MITKLSPAQERIMKWLYGGWMAIESVGAVYINNNRVCTLSTMNALLRNGLVTQAGNTFMAKRCPCCKRTKPLTSENVCDSCYI